MADQHLILDIGPGLLTFLMGLPVLIAACTSAYFSVRTHAQVALTDGKVVSALEIAAKDRQANGLAPAPAHAQEGEH